MKKSILFFVILSNFLFQTTNAQNWTWTGFSGKSPVGFAFLGNYVFAAVSPTAGFYYSTDNGNSWTARNTGITNFSLETIALHDSTLFLGTYAGGILRSTNLGLNWSAVNTGLAGTRVFDIGVQDSNIFACSRYEGVFLSTNDGGNWIARNNGITNLDTWEITFSGNNIFVGTSGGVFLSSDTGATWVAVNNGLTNLEVQHITSIGNSILAGTIGGGVFKSTDNGATWTAANTGIGSLIISGFATLGNNVLVITDNGGVYLSTDEGSTWISRIGNNIGWDTRTIGIGSTSVFLGFIGAAAYKTDLSILLGVEELNDKSTFSIYPNPVTNNLILQNHDQKTTIKELSIFNAQGENVYKNENIFIYNEEVNIDLAFLAKGIYFVKLTSGDKVFSKKIVLN